jgi:Amt family ammonium transporter
MSSDSIINTAIAAPTRRRIPLNAKRLAVGAVVGASTLLVLGGTAIAQTVDALVEEPVADLETVAKTADHAIQSGNLLWIVIGAAMVIFMQAGFALVETGFCRAKHAAHVVSTNLAVFFLGFVGFFLVGWSFMFGGYSYVLPGFDYGLNQAAGGALIGSGDWVFLWQGGWAGTWFDGGNLAYSGAAGAFFLYMVAFMDTTATIPTGSMAERWKFKSFVVWGLFCGAIYYPLFGAWTWGGGWLAKLGNSLNWGNGYVDFAGSGVVHAAGGVAALAGAIVLGPRIGKFTKDGKPRALPGHHIPMALLGTLILLFGWFGFNAASTFASSDPQIGVVAVNTALAAAFGGFVSMLWIWKRTGKPDPAMMANGMLAGLVIITAPCAFVDPWVAALLGAFAGVVVIEAVFFIERRLKIDDPVGAIAVHGVCGTLGVIAVGLLANGKYGVDAGGAGIGWNGTTTSLTDGVADGVTGLFYGGNGAGQLMAQLAGVVVLWTLILGVAFAFFKIQNALTKGGIRTDEAEEIAGLDMAEMGVFAYPEFSGTHEGLVSSDA